MGRQIADTIKSRRLQVLQSLLDDQARSFNQAMLGRHVDVLLERSGRHDGQLVGRSPYLQAVHLDADGCAIGDLVTAVVTDIQSHSLGGRRVDAPVEGISTEVRA